MNPRQNKQLAENTDKSAGKPSQPIAAHHKHKSQPNHSKAKRPVPISTAKISIAIEKYSAKKYKQKTPVAETPVPARNLQQVSAPPPSPAPELETLIQTLPRVVKLVGSTEEENLTNYHGRNSKDFQFFISSIDMESEFINLFFKPTPNESVPVVKGMLPEEFREKLTEALMKLNLTDEESMERLRLAK